MNGSETRSLSCVQAEQLTALLESYGSCAIAFSAGVDSTVVAKAAQLALGAHAIAVTGVGPALAEGELEEAQELAQLIGIEHVVTSTDEIRDEAYTANATDRCFHCKTELYGHVQRIAEARGIRTLVNGANLDDRGDYRPGMQAATDFAVRSPLIDCGVTKQQVRALAAHWGLPVAEKPATPCLASRIAYGVQVTPDRLRRIDLAEQYLRSLGLVDCRVRLHQQGLARIEVPSTAIEKLATMPTRENLVQRFRELGFEYITIDLLGFRSGSLNAVIPLESIGSPGRSQK